MRRILIGACACAALWCGVVRGVGVRQVRFTDFSEVSTGLTLGGEFPGAKGTLAHVAEKGERFDRLSFDLTKGNYVGFIFGDKLPEGTTKLKFRLRVHRVEKPSLFVRFHDATGQDHLHHVAYRPAAEWGEFTCDVKASGAHWGGANDGVLHWPVTSVTFGLEVRGGAGRVGTCDVADYVVTTTADERTLPAYTLTCASTRFGGLYRPDECATFRAWSFARDVGAAARDGDIAVEVTDWNGARVCGKKVRAADLGALAITPDELGGRFGAFKVALRQGDVMASTWFARLTGPAPKPCYWVGTGTHGGHGWARGDLRYLDILTEAGIGMVREDFCWDACEDGPDGFRMPPRFKAYAEALHARGIALNCIFNGRSRVHANPFDPQAAARWCAWAVKEFGDTVNDYELWNEPHNFGFRKHYQKDPKDNDGWIRKFVEFSRACRDAIVAERPGANVLLTAEDVYAFFNRMVDFGIARDNDVLSFHPYCHSQIRPEREMFFSDDGAYIRKLAADRGGAHRFRVTEAGWTTVQSTNMTHAFVGCYPRSTYHDQARYMARMFLLSRALGIESAMQYDFRNDGSDRFYTENNFGLVHEDYSPKPALAAVAFLTRLLGTAEPKGALSTDRAKYRIYAFDDAARRVLAAWSVEGDAEVDLPAGWEGAACYDLQGNKMPLPCAAGRLRLTETPIYLVLDPARGGVAGKTVRPENTDEVLVNPDMGLVLFHYSNRQWAYGQLQERGDVLDWFPGTGCAYFRLPWCLLEPEEGVYRWDLFDSYAAPFIAAGKQIGFRVTCCESRYTYATPEWVRRAGAKGWMFKMKMAKIFGREPPGSETEIWEPDYGDPVFLAKLENFLKAMARRYDGKPYVAFMDVGTIGMWGEGHTRAYHVQYRAANRDPEAAFHRHYELHRRVFPNTTILCIDDQAGAQNLKPVPEVPLMKHARDLGFGFRDDSIMVFTKDMVPARFHANPAWFHANWAQAFAPIAPVFVEHEHYDLSTERGAWSDDKLVESVEAYQASWLSIHGWPKVCFEGSKDAYARAARRLGYRFELREATFPEKVKLGESFTIASTWVNVGVARRYKGATLAWSLLDEKGRVAWVSADESFDFADAQPKLGGVEHPVALRSRCTCGWTGEIPQINDGVWVYTQAKKVGNFATDTRVPTLAPGRYTLCASLGERDGTPRLALPLKGNVGKRYPIGEILVY